MLIMHCWNGNNALYPSVLTYIFEGQHDGCDDASYKCYNPKDTEKALTLGEVHLRREKFN